MEKVWWALEDEVCANHLYASLEAVQDAIVGFFARFSREDALRLTARHQEKPKVTVSPVAVQELLPMAA